LIGNWGSNNFKSAVNDVSNFVRDIGRSIKKFLGGGSKKVSIKTIENPTIVNSDPLASTISNIPSSFFGGGGTSTGGLGITTGDVVSTSLDFVPIAGSVKDIYREDNSSQNGRVNNVSQDGLNFIAQYEGFSPTVYKVGGKGNPTIGFGHEVLSGEDFSGGITRVQGLDLLRSDAQIAVNAINRFVTVPLNQHQFDALTSYVFNAGSGNTLIKTNLKQEKYLSL